ncbi:PREDICTED: uncharacterized protein LOC104808188 [Tarenaya hassleriana]|uniref:uncharacterized protein LOC104808188 n=1 Tax=Tarenaya hassleriana TaxID=28532 RepID=UPI00053C8422|nr:PREDICTED: uncharacterized protein LOC104808188 [Tarenaya hassleriana]
MPNPQLHVGTENGSHAASSAWKQRHPWRDGRRNRIREIHGFIGTVYGNDLTAVFISIGSSEVSTHFSRFLLDPISLPLPRIRLSMLTGLQHGILAMWFRTRVYCLKTKKVEEVAKITCKSGYVYGSARVASLLALRLLLTVSLTVFSAVDQS